MVSILFDVVYALLGLFLSPFVLWRMLRHGRYRDGWSQRFGAVPLCETGRKRVWIHAVSVGEVNAARTLIDELSQQVEVVVSVTTDTGMARARAIYGDRLAVFFFPWDFSWAVRRALKRVRPGAVVLMEGEVWPNFTVVAQRLGVAMVVANGRVGGNKGWPRYRKLRWLVTPMFGRLTLVLAQDEVAAERFAYLGVPREKIKTVGSLKYDTASVGEVVVGAAELVKRLKIDGAAGVWVAGSTGSGEEELVLVAYETLRQVAGLEALRLVIVPRKPERFDEVAGLIVRRGHRLLRYSAVKRGELLGDRAGEAVILGDTMGDLRAFYSVASAAFVGRSLVAMGGSDMLEAVGLGKAVVVGPYTENFMEAVRQLVAGRGIKVVANREQMQEVFERLLKEPAEAKAMGQRGQAVILEQCGATQRTVAAMRPWLSREGLCN